MVATRCIEDTPPAAPTTDAEVARLDEASIGAHWRRWGPYLAERQWGTVREDYSPGGDAWDSFPHDNARSRAYRWGEDGLVGIRDDQGYLCFALAHWNEADPILKQRFFGLTGSEGNHGEDVKEYYFYLDSTPTHSFMKALYKYPQHAFPYAWLLEESRRRTRLDPEYELLDTGVFADDRYCDVAVEYAKATPDDIVIRITATNRGPDPAPLHVLPTLWFRNIWSWGRDDPRPELRLIPGEPTAAPHCLIRAEHHALGTYWLACVGAPHRFFTENETNAERLWGAPNRTPYVKDGIDAAVVHGRQATVNPDQTGTKAGAHYTFTIPPDESRIVLLRLSDERHADPFADAAAVLESRQREADQIYARVVPTRMPGDKGDGTVTADARLVQRQVFAGLLWSKSSGTASMSTGGWRATPPARRRPPRASAGATGSGGISITTTSSRCRIHGNIPGTLPGTSPSSASRWRW
jgi:hypothetical protein